MILFKKLIAMTCLTAGVAAWAVVGYAQQSKNVQGHGQLDADQNGLYDDNERKALLETLQKAQS